MAKLQVLLTEPSALNPAEFVNPPKWLVRMLSTNCGKPGKKYPLGWTQTRPMYSYPGGPQDDYPWGMGYSEEVVDVSGRSEPWPPNARNRSEEETHVVIRGNLREEQYRFWNGSGSMVSNIATCRWCRHWAYGQDEMRKHQSLTDHTRILREIYDCARKLDRRMCFACKAKTRGERWGIPMCGTNRCRNRWRVAAITDVSGTLLVYARFAFLKGLLAPWIDKDKREIHNLEEHPKPFNWERADAY